MPTKYETYANQPNTTLSASATAIATTISVTSATDFPTDGNFRIRINSELLLVTDVSGTTFTVVRGQEGTTGAAHAASDTVSHVVTEAGLRRAIYDHTPVLFERPLLNSLTDSSGTDLTLADFTWDTQGTGTVVDLVGGGLNVQVPPITANAEVTRMLYRAKPASTFTVTIGFIPTMHTFATTFVGLATRRNSDGRSLAIFQACGSGDSGSTQVAVYRHSAQSVFASNALARQGWYFGTPAWLRVSSDGTFITFYQSVDGIVWNEVYQEGIGVHVTTLDSVGFMLGAFTTTGSNTRTVGGTLLHWSES